MSYYRLRDIKTPPFAYLLNQDEVIRCCHQCDMPMEQMGVGLRVEICALDSAGRPAEFRGRPMMADYWLIGDDGVRAALERLVPGGFRVEAVRATLNPGPRDLALSGGRPATEAGLPDFFSFLPARGIELDPALMRAFPPLWCEACGRHIPNIPIDFQPSPARLTPACRVASLRNLYLEGYDYLFHENLADDLRQLFPQMMLERLVAEPINL